MNRTRRFAIPSLMLVVVATACAERTVGTGEAIAHPLGPKDLVLREETAGGFVAPSYALTQVPEVSLFGDGRVITTGPQIELYPGPALPNLQITRLSEDGVQVILRAARVAGLFGLTAGTSARSSPTPPRRRSPWSRRALVT